jgi:hypothetical protein
MYDHDVYFLKSTDPTGKIGADNFEFVMNTIRAYFEDSKITNLKINIHYGEDKDFDKIYN